MMSPPTPSRSASTPAMQPMPANISSSGKVGALLHFQSVTSEPSRQSKQTKHVIKLAADKQSDLR